MQGVEILSQKTIPIINNSGTSFLTGLLICFVIGIVLSICLRDSTTILIMLTIGVFVGAMLYPISDKKTGEYIEYKVTISDDVNLNEFNEKYEIINQEGKIYTVKERK